MQLYDIIMYRHLLSSTPQKHKHQNKMNNDDVQWHVNISHTLAICLNVETFAEFNLVINNKTS